MNRSAQTLALIATLAGAASFIAPLASAQSAAAPTRAEVKAEARTASKAGEIPNGEQGPKEAPFKAGQTRAERKAKTKEAIAKGEMTPRGEAAPPEAQAKLAKADSNTPRAVVKAETRAANKAGALRAGESYPEKSR